jgi:hypothetical protein
MISNIKGKLFTVLLPKYRARCPVYYFVVSAIKLNPLFLTQVFTSSGKF